MTKTACASPLRLWAALLGACSCVLSSVLWKPLRQRSPTRPSSRCPQEPPQTAKSLCNSFGARQPGSPLCNWARTGTQNASARPLSSALPFQVFSKKILSPFAVGRCLRALSVDKDSMCITTTLVCSFAGCLQLLVPSKHPFQLFRGSPCDKDLRRPSSRCPQEPPKKTKSLCNSFGARQPGSPFCNWARTGTHNILRPGPSPLLCLFMSSRRRSSPLLRWAVA